MVLACLPCSHLSEERALISKISGACTALAIPKCPGGEAKKLSIHNVCEFTALLKRFYLRTGVQRQVEAFREGVRDLFPPGTSDD